MSTHTKGPWVQKRHGREIQIWSEVVTGRMTESVCVAVINGELGAGNDEALMQKDADLIAAAPDMLAALEAILPYINAGEALIARTAIAKARGQQ